MTCSHALTLCAAALVLLILAAYHTATPPRFIIAQPGRTIR